MSSSETTENTQNKKRLNLFARKACLSGRELAQLLEHISCVGNRHYCFTTAPDQREPILAAIAIGTIRLRLEEKRNVKHIVKDASGEFVLSALEFAQPKDTENANLKAMHFALDELDDLLEYYFNAMRDVLIAGDDVGAGEVFLKLLLVRLGQSVDYTLIKPEFKSSIACWVRETFDGIDLKQTEAPEEAPTKLSQPQPSADPVKGTTRRYEDQPSPNPSEEIADELIARAAKMLQVVTHWSNETTFDRQNSLPKAYELYDFQDVLFTKLAAHQRSSTFLIFVCNVHVIFELERGNMPASDQADFQLATKQLLQTMMPKTEIAAKLFEDLISLNATKLEEPIAQARLRLFLGALANLADFPPERLLSPIACIYLSTWLAAYENDLVATFRLQDISTPIEAGTESFDKTTDVELQRQADVRTVFLATEEIFKIAESTHEHIKRESGTAKSFFRNIFGSATSNADLLASAQSAQAGFTKIVSPLVTQYADAWGPLKTSTIIDEATRSVFTLVRYLMIFVNTLVERQELPSKSANNEPLAWKDFKVVQDRYELARADCISAKVQACKSMLLEAS